MRRPLPPAWAAAAVAGALVTATGWLPWSDARATTTRVGPILGFLAALTVIAELADEAGLFELAAAGTARLARGRTWRVFALVAVLATGTTITLSLDTTAVLLTPVVLALTETLALPALPFALLVVWLANTASLLLPISNLTNLLAQDRLRLPTSAYVHDVLAAAAAAVVVSVAVLAVRFRRDLRGRCPLPTLPRPPDRALLAVSLLACLATAPASIVGVPPWEASVPAAVALALAFLARGRRRSLRLGLVPWRILLLTEGLFLVVAALGRHGLDSLLAHAAGAQGGSLGVLRTAGVGAAASNAVNNLPAYLAVERAVPPGHKEQLIGLLLGTDLGPLVLIWSSLATLLWNERCRARGLRVNAWQFARLGLVGAPLVLLAAWAALQIP